MNINLGLFNRNQNINKIINNLKNGMEEIINIIK